MKEEQRHMVATGGPANPILHETEMSVSGKARNSYAAFGLSVWDHFAAHAPDVPAWFGARDENGQELGPDMRFFAWRSFYASKMVALRLEV